MDHSSELEELDRAVDLNIKDKSRAARLKEVLHRQYDLPRIGRERGAAEYSGYDEAEDLWDNVPV